jgi:hypothetical protein
MTGSMHGWFANSPLIAPLLIERAVAVRRGVTVARVSRQVSGPATVAG